MVNTYFNNLQILLLSQAPQFVEARQSLAEAAPLLKAAAGVGIGTSAVFAIASIIVAIATPVLGIFITPIGLVLSVSSGLVCYDLLKVTDNVVSLLHTDIINLFVTAFTKEWLVDRVLAGTTLSQLFLKDMCIEILDIPTPQLAF